MSETRWRWVILAAVLWYCVWAILFIQTKPGLQYDEAIDVRAAVHLRHSHEEIKLQHAPDTWFCLDEHCFPLMSTRYTGAIKDYLCLPLFAMFGPSAGVVRLLGMALGALGIFGIATLLGRLVSYPVAAAAAWVMAIHPSYLDMTVFDNSLFSPWMAAFGLLCLAASAYLKMRTPRTAFWVGVTLGLGVWARANYVWLLGALFAALVLSCGRRLLLPFRHWMAIAVGGIVGGLPFLAYQAISGGGTWEAVDLLPLSGSFGQRFQYRLVMLLETFLSDGEHRRIWAGPLLSKWQLLLFPSMIALACVICIAKKPRCGLLPRIAALTLMFLTGILFSVRLAVAEHHIVTLIPIAAVVVVLAGCELLARYRWTKALVITVAAVYIMSAMYWQFAALAGLRRTGGVGVWSDAVFPLTKRLGEDFPGREIKVLDWGLESGVYVLSDGRVQTREIFWSATSARNDENMPWLDEVRRGGVFLLNGPQNRQIPAASIGFLRALAEGRPAVRRYTVPQRNGAPYAEVIEVIPNTFGTGPVMDSAVGHLQEILANDPLLAEKSTGFYGVEQGGWQWTMQEFSLVFPPSKRAASLTVHLNVPETTIKKLGAITLNLKLGDHVFAPEIFSHPGDYTVTRSFPAEWVGAEPIRFDFALDKAIPPTATDFRRLGIIFVSASLD